MDSVADRVERTINRSKVERDFKWTEWRTKVPTLNFQSEWDVRIEPPWCGALIRFSVFHNDKFVSVYLDSTAELGSMYDENDEPVPYWEIYPNEHDDTDRFYLDETDKMMAKIAELLNAGGKSDES